MIRLTTTGVHRARVLLALDTSVGEPDRRRWSRRGPDSGYWRRTDTLRDDLRVRSYLASSRNRGIRAIDAIHRAFTGNPWLPPITA